MLSMHVLRGRPVPTAKQFQERELFHCLYEFRLGQEIEIKWLVESG